MQLGCCSAVGPPSGGGIDTCVFAFFIRSRIPLGRRRDEEGRKAAKTTQTKKLNNHNSVFPLRIKHFYLEIWVFV